MHYCFYDSRLFDIDLWQLCNCQTSYHRYVDSDDHCNCHTKNKFIVTSSPLREKWLHVHCSSPRDPNMIIARTDFTQSYVLFSTAQIYVPQYRRKCDHVRPSTAATTDRMVPALFYDISALLMTSNFDLETYTFVQILSLNFLNARTIWFSLLQCLLVMYFGECHDPRLFLWPPTV